VLLPPLPAALVQLQQQYQQQQSVADGWQQHLLPVLPRYSFH
jgi:hypothetical protein